MNNYINMDNTVYIILATDKGCAGTAEDPYTMDAHAVAATYDLAEKIAKADVESGSIFPDYSIQKMFVATTESDV